MVLFSSILSLHNLNKICVKFLVKQLFYWKIQEIKEGEDISYQHSRFPSFEFDLLIVIKNINHLSFSRIQ